MSDAFEQIDAKLEAFMRTIVDGSAAPDDYAALEKRLLADRNARAYYLRLLQTDAALTWEHAPQQKSTTPLKPGDTSGGRVPGRKPQRASQQASANSHKRPQPKPTPFIIYPISIAAAALLTAAIVVVYLLAFTNPSDPQPDPIKPNQPGPSVATLIENTGDLQTPHGYPAEGEDFSAGEYTLSTGTAEFMLTNAVNVKLRGDTRMHMRNDMNVALTRGSAEFVCPTDAKGFTVHLPDRSKIVDLGTAFRVEIDDAGLTKVRVTEGSVEWTPAGTGAQAVLVNAGHSVHIDRDRGFIKSTRYATGELGVLAGWYHFGSTDAAFRSGPGIEPSAAAADVIAELSGGSGTRMKWGSQDGTFGDSVLITSADDGATAEGSANGCFAIRTERGENIITIIVTNRRAEPIVLDRLVFDYAAAIGSSGTVVSSIDTITLEYVDGDLDERSATVVGAITDTHLSARPPASLHGDYDGAGFNLTSTLSDSTLGPGESATFRISGSDKTDPVLTGDLTGESDGVATMIDNIAVLGRVGRVHEEPPASH